MLVEVPMSVQVPPRMEAKESGISSLEGDRPRAAASEIMMGMNTTTTGVLLMNAEISATLGNTTSSRDQSFLPT